MERVIFFLCDFKIYACLPNKTIKVVDSAFSMKKVNENVFAYQTLGTDGKKGNEIKYLSVTFSDYFVVKTHEEVEGKLLDF